MTGQELTAALAAFGVSQKWFADRLGVAPSTVQRWCGGAWEIKPFAAFAIDLMRRLPPAELAAVINETAEANRRRGRPRRAGAAISGGAAGSR